MDISHKLPGALRHQEVGWKALQDSNIRFPVHEIEVAVGNLLPLPLPLQGDHAVDVIGGAYPNTNLLHE
jgi:hypothetical protein